MDYRSRPRWDKQGMPIKRIPQPLLTDGADTGIRRYIADALLGLGCAMEEMGTP